MTFQIVNSSFYMYLFRKTQMKRESSLYERKLTDELNISIDKA